MEVEIKWDGSAQCWLPPHSLMIARQCTTSERNKPETYTGSEREGDILRVEERKRELIRRQTTSSKRWEYHCRLQGAKTLIEDSDEDADDEEEDEEDEEEEEDDEFKSLEEDDDKKKKEDDKDKTKAAKSEANKNKSKDESQVASDDEKTSKSTGTSKHRRLLPILRRSRRG